MKSLTDLRKLRHVVGVARAGSFTSAANNLAITQSALTKSVAEIEHLLGVRLFERLPRGVNLTAAGKVFVPRAERILADTAELMADLERIQSLAAGHLRIGVTPAGFVNFLERPLSRFAGQFPGVQISVTEGSDHLVQGLIQGDLDLIVGATAQLEPWTELALQPLTQLRQSFIARKQHPLTEASEITPHRMMAFPVVMPAAGLA